MLCKEIADMLADLNNTIRKKLNLQTNAEFVLLKYWIDCSGNIFISMAGTSLPNSV